MRGFTEKRVLEQLPEDHISDLREYYINENVLWSLCYNEKTIFPEDENLNSHISPEELLELAKNPGLGIRGLHERGYTGEGVTVAIIDRPVIENHPEFAGKIVKYKDFCNGADRGNMHGAAVASALAGETTGTAPGVKIYFAGAGEVLTTAQALDWIVEENEKLPEGEKIRVVSISMAPNDLGSPDADQWLKSRERAEAAGLLVLDADKGHGLFSPAYFDISKANWESPEGLQPGQWNRPWENREQYEVAGYYEEGLFVPIIYPEAFIEALLAERP